MTRLWWVRHAPTHAKTMVGRTDLPADLRDLAALARLRDFLPKTALIVSSDLLRAIQTADAIAAGRSRLPHLPGLREFDYGAWEGLHWSEIAARWPDLSRACWEAPGHSAPPQGESWNLGAARISAAVDRLALAHPGRDIVVVAHVGVILTQLQRARACSAAEILAQRIDNLSVTLLSRQEAGWQAAGWREQQTNHIP